MRTVRDGENVKHCNTKRRSISKKGTLHTCPLVCDRLPRAEHFRCEKKISSKEPPLDFAWCAGICDTPPQFLRLKVCHFVCRSVHCMRVFVFAPTQSISAGSLLPFPRVKHKSGRSIPLNPSLCGAQFLAHLIRETTSDSSQH